MSAERMIYDVIGLGFGPANLAIAGALVEKANESSPISIEKVLFIERHDEFKWHPGMLLPGARMQISFLKDLATLRSPQSPITFISYLHSQNRLVDFINRGSTIPTRKEYSDYLSWVAQYVQDQGVRVAYGEQVVALDERDRKVIEIHSRVVLTGAYIVRWTKNLIISPGGSPRIPRPLENIHPRGRTVHSSSYLPSVEPLLKLLKSSNPGCLPLRIAVVGSGQSAAEVLLDLHSRLSSIPIAGTRRHTLDMIIRKGSLKPSDDSPFANEIFNPEKTDAIFGLPTPSARQRIRLEYENTNYGVVNPRTLESLYEVMYEQKLDEGISKRTGRSTSQAKPTIAIQNYSEILSAESSQASGGTHQTSGPITLTIQHTLTHEVHERTYDAIFCATGYERRSWLHLLASPSLGKHFNLDSGVQDCCTRLAAESEIEEGASGGGNGLIFQFVDNATGGGHSCNASSSSTSTPATSEGSSQCPSAKLGEESAKKLYITRAYRLLPRASSWAEMLKARIYLQGLAEETHGLSDTLLSVVGIRAGEVVDDLCAQVAIDAKGPPSARM
ncbi:hypothetical protein HYDPIDRAFT_24148 [Hydnomerulius pinastri MD-312]|nr:hypothetical protein HYDPIDRAFT_24148 [Hydnomerulius pinastri MD-312]